MENQPTSDFINISIDDVCETLGKTIKKDDSNKILVFLAMLLVYTEESQINISFIAPSSSGKSFIPLEVSKLFPAEDVWRLGNVSPTAFYHEQGKYEDEAKKDTIIVDLSRKIIIFLDQPGPELLARFRALLSHDEKIITSKITDKNQRGGNRTKTVKVIGFPVVVFCSANLRMDEQESTRMLVLSPDINTEKIRQGIVAGIRKATDKQSYMSEVEADPQRAKLKERVRAVKDSGIKDVKIRNRSLVEDKFFALSPNLRPRQQRDIIRVVNIIKSLSLLNFGLREREEDVILASDDDIEEGFMLWTLVSESQELNLSPYVHEIYEKVIHELFLEKKADGKVGEDLAINKKEFAKKHLEIYGRVLPDWQFAKDVLPELESAGLVSLGKDPREGHDHRQTMIYPTTEFNISAKENNIEMNGGVNSVQFENSWHCTICDGMEYWVRDDGEKICSACHPQLVQEIEEAVEGIGV